MAADNQFSALWYQTFLDTIDPAQTARELAFLERHLPLDTHTRILDLCCGRGRHANALAQRGYQVTGIDQDAGVLAQARAAGTPATFIQADMRSLDGRAETWDGIISMWASFGYFTAEENRALLAGLFNRLTPHGRIVLDVYNRDFFSTRLGTRRNERAAVEVIEHKTMDGDRLTTELRYPGMNVTDRFSWQVFRPHELLTTTAALGFEPLALCTGFEEHVAPTADHARMQLVLKRGVTTG